MRYDPIISLIPLFGMGILLVIPHWFIFKKAGYSGWRSLTILVPFLNILMIWLLGFSEWPVQKEIRKKQR
ncbi:MAG: hypothetical protein QXR60_05480 [Candidatus Nanoarchaeia archaeon]